MYGLGVALSTGSHRIFLALAAARRPPKLFNSQVAAVGYGVTALAGLYTLYYFVFVLVGHLLWAFLCQFLCAERRSLRRIGVSRWRAPAGLRRVFAMACVHAFTPALLCRQQSCRRPGQPSGIC
jgi:hypothetical protein